MAKGLWTFVGAGVGAAAGAGIGFFLGGPVWAKKGLSLGFSTGIAIGAYLDREKSAKINIPDKKKTLLSPSTLVSSNVPIPLGFGTFYSAGNILDFLIQRAYFHSTWRDPDPNNIPDDVRTYWIATGISANPAEISSGKIGKKSFIDSIDVTTEFFPNGGKSKIPVSAQSSYSKTFRYPGVANFPNSWDTDWVRVFSDTSLLLLRYEVAANITLEWVLVHSDVWIYTRIDGVETSRKLTTSDFTEDPNDSVDHIVTFYEEVTAGEYRITFTLEDLERNDHDDLKKYLLNWIGVACFIRDNFIIENPTEYTDTFEYTDLGATLLDGWVFQSNWFAMKFCDDYFNPDDSTLELVYDQGDENPIRNLQAYMTNLDWGLKIPESKIDTSSFDTQIARCTTDGLTFNGLFTSQTSPSDIIKQFLITAKALMVYSQGKFKLIEDTFATPSKSFEESNTLTESFQYTRKDIGSMISRLKVDFEDSEHSYIVRSVLLDSPTLFEKIGIKETSQFLTGVNTETQAKDIGAYLFRNVRQPGSVVLKASINDADIEPGQMFEAIRPAVQYGGVFRAVEIQEDQKDDIQIAGVAYFPEDEEIVISTEDDFRRGTLSTPGETEASITRIEDGEVYGSGGAADTEFTMEMGAEADVYTGAGLSSELEMYAVVGITVF